MPLRVIQHYSDWVCTAAMSNESITIAVWLALTRLSLQCGYRNKTVKSSRYVQLPNSKSKKELAYTDTVTRREPDVCQPKH